MLAAEFTEWAPEGGLSDPLQTDQPYTVIARQMRELTYLRAQFRSIITRMNRAERNTRSIARRNIALRKLLTEANHVLEPLIEYAEEIQSHCMSMAHVLGDSADPRVQRGRALQAKICAFIAAAGGDSDVAVL